MAKKENPVNAFARASHDRSSRFGHLTIHVHELFGWNGATLKISCQSGGDIGEPWETTYAWQHGLANDYSVLKIHELQKGYYLMRRIEKHLAKQALEFGPIKTFAEYAVRVLVGATVPVVHVLETLNGTLPPSVEIKDLPGFDPQRDQEALLAAFDRMEKDLIAHGRR